LAIASAARASDDFWNAGPFFDQFPLTLSEGTRTEAVGPFFYCEDRDLQNVWAVPPVMSRAGDRDIDWREFDFFYPVATYDRFGPEYRFQLLQLLSFSGGATQSGDTKDRFTLFPIYFQQRSTDENLNYTALFPIYGKLKNRLFRDEIDFVLWPLYVKTVRHSMGGSVLTDELLSLEDDQRREKHTGELTTYNFVAPIFHLRYGDGLRGWQFWPLAGHEHKEVTVRTNSWGDAETVPGHDKTFILWPMYWNQTRDIGTTNTAHFNALIPFYAALRSPARDSTTYLWPFGLSLTEDRAREFHEVGFLWPVFAFARGEGKTTTRVWPLFGRSHNAVLERNFYLWPVYRYSRIHSDPLDRRRTQILFFLYSDVRQMNTATEKESHRVDFWPLFTRSKDFSGNSRLQVFSLLEPIFPNNKSIERNYSQLWSVWRSERNAKTHASSQSLLWNLYRHQVMPEGRRKTSLLFGLFQHERTEAGSGLRLLFIPFKHVPEADSADVDSAVQLKHSEAGRQP